MARDWGVRHPDGKVTVSYDGHPLGSRTHAEQEIARFDAEMLEDGCSECTADAGVHVPVFRDVPSPPPWTDADPG